MRMRKMASPYLGNHESLNEVSYLISLSSALASENNCCTKRTSMALACQKDSYLRKLSTTVKSCKACQTSMVINGKKQKVDGFDVILEDTILFPEGGGQPDDRGQISGVDVLRVSRRGAEAVHLITSPFDIGSEVTLSVDWTRRWDNMQQHSAQHLITAIADAKFGFPTTSWNLGEKTSFIELDTPNMSSDQMEELEDLVNEKIRDGLKMYPTLYDSVEDPELAAVRARGLPDDHVGPVRVVSIEGIENNMCCGTHVSSLSHLQAVKLLVAEKAKKGKVNLVFVAGRRLLDYLGKCYQTEKTITSMIKGGPDQHIELLDKLQNSFKVTSKNSTTLLREVASLEANAFKSSPNKDRFLSIHRREGDNEYMNLIVNEISDPSVLIFITTGDEKGAGLFVLSGMEEDISTIGPAVAGILDGKGAGKKGRFQGKANKLSKRQEAEKHIRDFLLHRENAAQKES